MIKHNANTAVNITITESSALRPPVLHVSLFNLVSLYFQEIVFFCKNLEFEPAHTTKQKKTQECLGQGLCSGALIFLFLVLLGFFVFGSGSFYRLLRPPKTQKPRGKPRKKTKDFQECLGQGFCSEALDFFIFWCSSSFFGFWLRKLLSANRTAKTQKPRRKPKKKTKDSQQCLGQGLCSEALVFLVFLDFFSFLAPEALSRIGLPKPKKQKEHYKKKQCSQECLGPGLSSETFFFWWFFVSPQVFCFLLCFSVFCLLCLPFVLVVFWHGP